jgi:hypothetical protein
VRAGVELGVTYPQRIISDLAAARQITVVAIFFRAFHAALLLTVVQVEWLLDARRAALHKNDCGGYDMISLPSGRLTRVFTKEEFRLGADGLVKPPLRDRSRAKPIGSKFKSAKKVGKEADGDAAGMRGASDCGAIEGSCQRGLAASASQRRLTKYFRKDTARVATARSNGQNLTE